MTDLSFDMTTAIRASRMRLAARRAKRERQRLVREVAMWVGLGVLGLAASVGAASLGYLIGQSLA